MIGRAMNFVLENNWSDVYSVLVWASVLLAVAWAILIEDDPANAGLPKWDMRLRRAGILIMVGGFLISVLFGGEQGWAPWPPMVLIAFGFDFYLGAAIFTGRRRAKIAERIAGFQGQRIGLDGGVR